MTRIWAVKNPNKSQRLDKEKQGATANTYLKMSRETEWQKTDVCCHINTKMSVSQNVTLLTPLPHFNFFFNV